MRISRLLFPAVSLRNLLVIVSICSLAGCLTPEVRHQQAVRAFIAKHEGIPTETRSALEAGVVMVGMTREEAFVAAGHDPARARMPAGFQTDEKGRLRLPRCAMVRPARSEFELVWLQRNTTQYASSTPEPFVVHFTDHVVARVVRGVTWAGR